MFPHKRNRPAAVVPAVLAGLLAIAGCATGHPSAAASPTPNAQDAMLVWVRCMRSHGVQVPEDPNATGFPKPPGGAAALQAAEDACRAVAPPKLQNGNDTAAQDRMLAAARCLRAHGLDVPDPQPGQGLSLPPGSTNNPAAQAAVSACLKPNASSSKVK